MNDLTEKTNIKTVIQYAKDLGIKEFIHAGEKIKVNTDVRAIQKMSLIEAIQKFESEQVENNESDIEDSESFESTSESLSHIKDVIRDGIREITFAEKANDFDKQFKLIGAIPQEVVAHIEEIASTPNMLTKIRSNIFSELEREYNDLDDSEFKSRFQYYFKNLRDNVYNSPTFRNAVQSKRETGNSRLKERKQNKTNINPAKLIVWAVDVLSKLQNYDRTHWKIVTQAIKTLTGRRSSEILSSGRFIPSTIQGCLLFKGQNKKHSEESFKSETPLLIPVIGGHTELVLQGMNWLNSFNQTQSPIRCIPKNDSWAAQMTANVLVNKNLGKYLSDFCKGADGSKLDWYGLIESDSDWTDKKKPDCTRDIYTQIMGVGYYELVKKELSGTLDFLSQILGHSGDKSIIKYDVDFSVKFTDVANFLKDVDLKNIPIK